MLMQLIATGCGSDDGHGGAMVDEALQLLPLHAEPDPVSGGRIVDSDGREVLLRGVNVNALVSQRESDMGKGPVFYSTLAQIEKAKKD
jgi:hypothetical protein